VIGELLGFFGGHRMAAIWHDDNFAFGNSFAQNFGAVWMYEFVRITPHHESGTLDASHVNVTQIYFGVLHLNAQNVPHVPKGMVLLLPLL